MPEDAKLVLRSASSFETTRIPPEALLALWIGEGWPEARFDAALVAALDRALIAHKSDRPQRAPERPRRAHLASPPAPLPPD